MSPDFIRYLKKNILATAILAIAGWLFFTLIYPKHYFVFFPYMLLFFCVFSLIVQRYLYRIAHLKVGKFASRFMAITMLKLFLLLTGVAVYILLNRESAVSFVVVFFILYIVYTTLEVSDIMPLANKN